MTEKEIRAITKHSWLNSKEISRSKMCGCYYCEEIFPASSVVEWQDYIDGKATAQCPCCGIDSVIGDAIKVRITKKLLHELHEYAF